MSKNDNLDRLFETFVFIKKSEGRDHVTITQYYNSYDYFAKFLDRRNIKRSFSEIDRHVIRDYINYMREEAVRFEDHAYVKKDKQTIGLTPATINTRLKTLRNMFNTLLDEEVIDRNPIKGVGNVSDPLEDVDVLSVKEMERLIKAPVKTTYAGFRDYVILHVLIDSMMRIGEALKLKVNYFNFDENTVTVKASIAKTRKSRILPLRPLTVKLVKKLIEINEDFRSEYVFLTNYGEPLKRDIFRKRLYTHAKKAGIKKRVYPNLLRHSAATDFLVNGGDLRHLQMLLGHADLRMIIRYTHLSDKALRDHHAKHSSINRASNKLSRPRKTKIDISDL